MDTNYSFSYWKHPFQKVALFILVLLTAFSFCAETYEFYFLASNPEKISQLFTNSDWESYSALRYFKLTQKFFMLFMLVATFLIGCTSKNEKSAYKREGVCWITASLYWCAVYGVLGDKFETIDFIMWLILFITTLTSGIYIFNKAKN
ncbi:MAG: hypothetical protein R3Y29_01255 [bacterium]